MADPKKPLSPDDRRMHIMLALLALAVMINVLGFSVIIPLIPDYVQVGMPPDKLAGPAHRRIRRLAGGRAML